MQAEGNTKVTVEINEMENKREKCMKLMKLMKRLIKWQTFIQINHTKREKIKITKIRNERGNNISEHHF